MIQPSSIEPAVQRTSVEDAGPISGRPASAPRAVPPASGEPAAPVLAREELDDRRVRKDPPPQIPTSSLQVRVEEDGRVIVKIVDEEQRVIREIPPEEVVAIARRLDKAIGLLFDRKA